MACISSKQSFVYHQHKVLYIIIAKGYTAYGWWYTPSVMIYAWRRWYAIAFAMDKKEHREGARVTGYWTGCSPLAKSLRVCFANVATSSLLAKVGKSYAIHTNKKEHREGALFCWCGWRDLNPHVSQHWNLKPARLPFRHIRILSFSFSIFTRGEHPRQSCVA